MRPVLQSDVTAAARALLAVPSHARNSHCARLLREAEWADRYARKLRKPHPYWGNGTLVAAAAGHVQAAEPTFDDPAYCAAVVTVLAQLSARSTGKDL